MRILFMGTPAFAVASLQALVEAGHEVCGVFTQPDKPKNRGHKMAFSPVKEYALSVGLDVYQPVKMKDGEALRIVQQLQPELTVVAAYGRILPEEILQVPVHGSINVHSSILPKYRGAAPINWAILNGEETTGVTIMHMAKELDAGDIIDVATTAIDPDETAEMLFVRLGELGAKTLLRVVDDIANGTAKRVPQDHSAMTYAPMLDKSLSPMDFTKPAKVLHDQVRGLIPWPCAIMDLQGTTVKVYATRVGEDTDVPAGGLVATKKTLAVACGDGKLLHILELQPEGGKRMATAAYLAGHPVKVEA